MILGLKELRQGDSIEQTVSPDQSGLNKFDPDSCYKRQDTTTYLHVTTHSLMTSIFKQRFSSILMSLFGCPCFHSRLFRCCFAEFHHLLGGSGGSGGSEPNVFHKSNGYSQGDARTCGMYRRLCNRSGFPPHRTPISSVEIV